MATARASSLSPLLGSLPVPLDYPSSEHLALDQAAKRLFERGTDSAVQKEFRIAHNAAAYRFASAADGCDTLVDSLDAHGDSPEMAERYRQERAFFEFIVAGVASLETLGFASYILGHVLAPDEFPLADERDRKRVTLENLSNLWKFSAGSFSVMAERLVAASAYQRWKLFRNVLAHRGHPGRQFYLSVGSARSTTLDPSHYDEFAGQRGPELSVASVTQMRTWLSEQLVGLFSALVLELP